MSALSKTVAVAFWAVISAGCTVEFKSMDVTDGGTDSDGNGDTGTQGSSDIDTDIATDSSERIDTEKDRDSETASEPGSDTHSDAPTDTEGSDDTTQGDDTDTETETDDTERHPTDDVDSDGLTDTATESEPEIDTADTTPPDSDTDDVAGTESDGSDDTETIFDDTATETSGTEMIDASTETDSDTTSDISTDTDSGTELETETWTDTETGSQTDTETESDTTSPTETELETDTQVCEIPSCVRFVAVGATGTPRDGSSWANAFLSVQAGIDAASVGAPAEGCEVWVKQGTYYVYKTLVSDTLQLAVNVRVYGGFNGAESTTCDRDDRNSRGNETIITGCQSALVCGEGKHVANVVRGANKARLDGFIVEKGQGDRGSGMANDSVTDLVVENCVFRDNAAYDSGGGMYNVRSSPTIRSCTFIGNTATNNGAGMYNDTTSAPRISRTVFVENRANRTGGAIANYNGGTARISDSFFGDNQATLSGAGIHTQNAADSVTVTNCSFRGNHALNSGTTMVGGGIFNQDGDLEIDKSVFVANVSGPGSGSAVKIQGSGAVTSFSADIVNSLFYRNVSTTNSTVSIGGSGGALSIVNSSLWDNDGGIAVESSGVRGLTVTSAIVWSNTSDAITVPVGFSPLVVRYSALDVTYAGTGNIIAAPGLVGQRDQDVLTGMLSCAFDEATYQTTVSVDQPTWTPGALRGLFLFADGTTTPWWPVVDNSDNAIRIWGDLTSASGGCADLAVFDFNLQGVSPCIDAGYGVDAPPADIQGNARVDIAGVANAYTCGINDTSCKTAVDIGAFELQ